ncbi:MAG TPA: sporulation protein SpoOM, partial [Candidatus Methylacidiphilales bacterium]
MKRLVLFLSLVLPLAAPAQVPTPTRLIPTSEIKPGMHGVSYTVLQGSEIVPLDTEILGVAENALGPGYDLIIGKLVDPKSALVEAVHGMSGSPLYIDGRLAGALSRRLTQFEKDGHCGFTPIADMLRVEGPDGKGTFASRAAKGEASEPPFSVEGLLRGQIAGAVASPGFAALGVPLSVTGLSAELTGKVLKSFGMEASGWIPVSGGSRSEARLAKAELQPGSPVSAVLMTGDLAAAGTGTLTWRDGDRVLAFGHPMLGVGRSAWGLAPAEIITTIPSYLYPHKLANTGPVVGTIVQDRLSAV